MNLETGHSYSAALTMNRVVAKANLNSIAHSLNVYSDYSFLAVFNVS